MHIILVVHCNSGKLQTVGEKGTVSANLLSARRRVNTELHTLVTRQRTQSMHRLRHAGRSWKTAQPPSFWSHHGRACPWRSFASSHASRHETHRLAKRQCHRFQALAAFGAFAWTAQRWPRPSSRVVAGTRVPAPPSLCSTARTARHTCWNAATRTRTWG